jgi:hypothetical protein
MKVAKTTSKAWSLALVVAAYQPQSIPAGARV